MTHSFPTRRSSDLARSHVGPRTPLVSPGSAPWRLGRAGRRRAGRAGDPPLCAGRSGASPMEDGRGLHGDSFARSEETTSELQSLMRISYAVFCLKKKKKLIRTNPEQ